MRITIEIDHKSELEKLKMLFKTLKIDSVSIVPDYGARNTPSIQKGNKRINPKELFGIWSDNPRSPDQIRKDAWEEKSATVFLPN